MRTKIRNRRDRVVLELARRPRRVLSSFFDLFPGGEQFPTRVSFASLHLMCPALDTFHLGAAFGERRNMGVMDGFGFPPLIKEYPHQ